MNNKFVLFSGSASRSCPQEQLERAFEFVESLTTEVLRAGGGFVLLLGNENQTRGDDGKPRIFDWIIMRGIESYVANTTEPGKIFARVVVPDDAWDRRMDDAQRQTFINLQQRGALSVERIERHKYAGGPYRSMECKLADALVALGGGKGTYLVGNSMLAIGKPVLPMDLEIGTLSEDGKGALQLHQGLLSDPIPYFPRTHTDVANRIESLSLNHGNHDTGSVALRAVEILSRELDNLGTGSGDGNKNLSSKLSAIVKKLLSIVGIIRAVEFLKNLITGG